MTTTSNTATPDYIVDGVLTEPEAWVPLQTIVAANDTSTSLTLSSSTGANDWSQYMDLVIFISAQIVDSGSGMNYLRLGINNDTNASTSYDILVTGGDGSSISVSRTTNPNYAPICPNNSGGTTANMFNANVGRFSDINSGKFKSYTSFTSVDKNAVTNNKVEQTFGVWLKQDPITSLVFYEANNFPFKQDSRFDLWGVLPKMINQRAS
tara:strand:- start:668 stop:1294 length:627 start_codon:yes stop_codon:yes gene_type:complete